MSGWRILASVLLGAAAVGAVVRSANSSSVGRVAGVIAALVLVAVGIGVFRGHRWAEGSAFFLGLFWLWAVLALRVQGVIGASEFFVWFGWSVVVMFGVVAVRPARSSPTGSAE